MPDWLSSLWAVVIGTVLLTTLVFILVSRTQDLAGRGIGWFRVYVLVKGASHASTSSGETLSLEAVPAAYTFPYGSLDASAQPRFGTEPSDPAVYDSVDLFYIHTRYFIIYMLFK